MHEIFFNVKISPFSTQHFFCKCILQQKFFSLSFQREFVEEKGLTRNQL